MEPGSAEIGEGAYHFGEFRFLPGRQLLLRGDSPVRLGSRALDLLRLLVERRGELLDKAELIRFAWPDTFVHEDNLKVNIAALRRALTPTGPEAPVIATVPGRGYRFVGAVRRQAAVLPPPPSPSAAELPAPSAIIGRDEAIAQIAAKLGACRLLTVAGAAGVGKTTIAVAAARQAAGRYPDGVDFIDFSVIGAAQLVHAAVAAGIGLDGHLKDIGAGIVEKLRGQRRLLVFDNCEHVLKAASLIAEHILSEAPGVTILATSREAFGSRTETVHRLAPLPCPPGDEALDSAQALAFPAVTLFVARAAAAAGFRLDDANAPIVTEICRRLDGLPLAIELAAPRLIAGDAPTLLRLLDHSFEALLYGPAQAPLRQQTLLATLDWSYRLLSEGEAAILRLLSVFAGAFTIEDAVGVGRQQGRRPEEIADGIAGLAAKSLLSAGLAQGALRYRLLESTRSYAAQRLRGAGEQRHVAAAHAAYVLELVEQAEAEWQWRSRQDWTAAHGGLANDLRLALDWAFGEEGDPGLGIRLAASAIPLWDELSSVGESNRNVRRALASSGLATCGPRERMKLATAHAWSLGYTERFGPEAVAAWRESLRLAELVGDTDYQLRSLWGLSSVLCFNGRYRQALASLARFRAMAAREEDDSSGPAGDRLRVLMEFYLGDIRGAHATLARMARHHDTPGIRARSSRFHIDGYVGIRKSLSVAEWVCGEQDRAVATAQAALDGAMAMGHAISQSDTLAFAVIPIALWMGQVDAAERHLAALSTHLNQRYLTLWEPSAHLFEGMIRHERGDAGGIDQMQAALAELAAARFLVRMPSYLTMLAEAALREGRMDLARESVARALALLDEREELWWQPEAIRVQGLLQWHEGDRAAAEATLLRAMGLAIESGALSFELRASLNLAECWAGDGRSSAAAELLDPVCRRFDVSATGRDILQARRLLERLSLPDRKRPASAAAAPFLRMPAVVVAGE